jgi:type I restriction enzyme S subunit
MTAATESEWPLRPLVELTQDRQISYGIVQPGSNSVSGVPIVRVKDVRDGRISRRDPLIVDPEISRRHARTILRGGEVLVTIVGSVGEVAVAPADLAGWNVARAIAVVRPTPEVEAEWVRLCFQVDNVRAVIASRLNTTVQATLNLADLKALRIPVPPFEVREPILRVLRALDHRIAANHSTTQSVDELLAVMLHGLLKDGFREVRLSTIARVNARIARPTDGGKLRYVDITSVGIGTYRLPPRTPWEGAPSRARRAIRPGDTIWSTVRPNRRSHALNLREDDELVGSTGLAVLTPTDVGFAYLYEATKRPEFSDYLETVAEGSAYPAVRAERFSDAVVPLPGRESLIDFEAKAAPMRRLVASLESENEDLAELRDTLLPHLMSGRLKIKQAEELVSDQLRPRTGRKTWSQT